MVEVPVVLTIAGFDPSSGAGVTADLKTIAAHGLYGVACATSLTVQSTQGVRGAEAVSARVVRETLACLAEDVEFAAIKIGMLGTAENAAAVCEFLRAMGARRPPTVLDTVLRSSSGRELLDAGGLRVLRDELLPLVDWATPNVEELGVLLGEPTPSREGVPAAAARLRALAGGGLCVAATRGDCDPPDDFLLATGGGRWVAGERVATSSTHGTGCAYSTALACGLALGDGPLAAAEGAKRFVAEALRYAYPVGKGAGPMHHLWRCGR